MLAINPSMSVSHTGMLPMPGTSTSERVLCITIIIASYGEPLGISAKGSLSPNIGYWVVVGTHG